MLEIFCKKWGEVKRANYIKERAFKKKMRGKSYEGKLGKEILKGPEGHCKLCKKDVQDLLAHNKSKHKA